MMSALNKRNPSASGPRRGVAYIRYSSTMQKDSFSLEAQERQIRERARQDSVELVQVFAAPAQSAYRKHKRPGIEAMLAAARRGEFNILYVHKVDRLARRLRWAIEIVEELATLGIVVKAVEQNFDLGTPEGKLIFNFLGGLGEFYSDNLSKETHKGKYERALSGYHNGSVTWGYRSEQVGEKKMALLIPELQPVLLGFFERFSTGAYSDQEMADWLNGQGFHRPSGRLFTKDTVRAMLQNPFYAGQVRYRGTKHKGANYWHLKGEWVAGKHQAVISLELFEQCQAIRARRRVQVKRRPLTRHVYFVNGIIHCTHCERHLRAQSSYGLIRYYREMSRQRGFQDCPYAGKSVKAAEIDEQIAQLIQHLVLPENWRKAVVELLQAEKSGPDPETERARLRADLRRLRENYERNLYAGEEHAYWRKVEQLQSQLAALNTAPQTQVIQLGERLISIQNAWALATQEERRELVHMVMEAVGCDMALGRIVWIQPVPGLEVLFRLVPGWTPIDGTRRYHIAGQEKK